MMYIVQVPTIRVENRHEDEIVRVEEIIHQLIACRVLNQLGEEEYI